MFDNQILLRVYLVKFQLCSAKELLSFCEGFILKNLATMMDVKNFRDTLFNNNGNDVSQPTFNSCSWYRNFKLSYLYTPNVMD